MQFIDKFTKMDKYKKIIISLCLTIMLALAATCGMMYIILKNDKIVNGTYIENLNVSLLSKEETKQLLVAEYSKLKDNNKFTLKDGSDSYSFNYSEAGLEADTEKAVNDAFAIGRSGNVFADSISYLKSSYRTKSVNMNLKIDNDTFDKFIDSLNKKVSKEVKEASLTEEGEKLTLTAGSTGRSVDTDKLKEALADVKYKTSLELDIPFKEISPKALNSDELYTKIKQDPQNAGVQIVDNNLSYTDEVTGRDIDKEELSKIVEELNNKTITSKELPVKYSKPDVKLADLKPKIFRDRMATSNTQFYIGDQNNDNRAYNIALAVKKISGKLLAPGETFSFNKVVGARTEAEGYKVAHVYSGGEIVDDVGGGICQVSSTLYNAALYSDLGIVERTNHMFTVGYIPLGQDAAVAYDYVDMKFKNTSNYPIKIVGEVTPDNRVVFSIIGTLDNHNRKVEIQNNIVKTLDFKTKYTNDPSLPKGTTQTKTYGMPGYVVESFKIIKENGNIVSNEKIHTSTYNPLSQEVLKGTAQ